MVPPQRVTDSTGPEGSAKVIRRFVGLAHLRVRGLILMPLRMLAKFKGNQRGGYGKPPRKTLKVALS